MNAKIEEIDGKYVATLEGEMDTAAAAEAEEVLSLVSLFIIVLFLILLF